MSNAKKDSQRLKQASLALAITAAITGTSAATAACDAGRGAAVAKKCTACHALDSEESRVGPTLLGIVDRPAAGVENFRYSRALRRLELSWTEANLARIFHK